MKLSLTRTVTTLTQDGKRSMTAICVVLTEVLQGKLGLHPPVQG